MADRNSYSYSPRRTTGRTSWPGPCSLRPTWPHSALTLPFFLMDNAALLAKKGFAETLVWQKKDEFSPAHELLKTLTEDFDVKFYICASCVKHYGLDKAELIRGAEIKPGSFLGEMLLERQSLTF